VSDNRTITLASGFFGSAGALLLIVFTIGLYRYVRVDGSGYAAMGATLSTLGFFVLTILLATSTISGLNLARLYDNASIPDKATVVTIATAVSGISPSGLFEIDTTLRGIGLAVLGAAMVRTANFGSRYGWVTIFAGTLYLPLEFGGLLLSFSSLFIVANLMFFPWVAILGWKLVSVSRKARSEVS